VLRTVIKVLASNAKHVSMNDPVEPAFRRLFDAKTHWHNASHSYFDPSSFRIAINSCIQELRNVTFVLQANKRDIEGFEGWYTPWQENMRANSSLRWLVDARNHVVKKGDLDMLSRLRIEVIGSYLAGEVRIFEEEYDSNLTNKDIYDKTIAQGLPAEVFENSYVKLERRWVDKNYPKYELLELLSECWAIVSDLLLDAPGRNVSSSESEASKVSLPPCMHEEMEMRAAWMRVKGDTLVPTRVETESVMINPQEVEQVMEKYGDSPLFKQLDSKSSLVNTSWLNQTNTFYEQAKYFLAKDGHHIHLAIIFVDSKPVQMVEIWNEEAGDKFLTMNNLVSRIERIAGDAVIIVSEAWTAAYDPNNHYRRPVDSPGRQEALLLVAASKDGENYCYSTPFFRNGEKISFGKQLLTDASKMNVIQPILVMWEKQQARDEKES